MAGVCGEGGLFPAAAYQLGPQIEVSCFTVEDNWNNGYVTIAHLPDDSAVEFTYRDPVADFYRFTKRGSRENGAVHYARKLQKVMRVAVREQIDAWKSAHPGTGHVDHAWPRTFSVLCARFRLELAAQDRDGDAWEMFIDTDKSLEPAYIRLAAGGQENSYMDVLESDAVLSQWQDFHAARARLRWLSSDVSMKIGNRAPRLCGYHDLPAGTTVP